MVRFGAVCLVGCAIVLGLGLSGCGGSGGSKTVAPNPQGGLTLTVLYKFAQSSGTYPHGAMPVGRLVQGTDGNFYGVTQLGGANDYGTVFKLTPAGALTTLHSFSSDTDGSYPADGLVEGPDGAFYGTAGQGGPTYGGSVYRITSAGAFSVLATLNHGGPGPEYPNAALLKGADGNLYGTTSSGSNQCVGCIYSISTGGGFNVLHSFQVVQAPITEPEGGEPYGSLIEGAGGALYGTTSVGGSADQDQLVMGHGTVFMITAGLLTTLHSFTGGIDSGAGNEGSKPMSGLTLGLDGNFYGTTSKGGSHLDSYGFGCGTIFKMTPAGALTTIYAFSGPADGLNPCSPLVVGPDGDLYGTTPIGGSGANGTIFKITPAGALTTLFSSGSNSMGGYPNGLILGQDGNLYGTTQTGRSGGDAGGTVFRISGF